MIRALLFIATMFLIWQIGGDVGAELVAKVIATTAVLLIFPLSYLWHFFKVPETMHREAATHTDQLEVELKALKLSKAEFVVNIDEVAWGGTLQDDPNRTGVTAVLRLDNIGARAGAIPNWAMWVEKNDDRIPLRLIAGPVHLNPENADSKISFAEEDLIVLRTRDPVQPGAFVQGYMTGTSEPFAKLNAGDKLIVQCKDVFGTVSRAVHVLTKAVGRHDEYAGMKMSRKFSTKEST